MSKAEQRPSPPPTDPIHRWIESEKGSELADFWHPDPPSTSFDAYYAAVMRHVRVHPAEALTAVERLGVNSRSKLSPNDRLRWHRLRGHVYNIVGDTGRSLNEYEIAWRGFLEAGHSKEMSITGIGYGIMLGYAGRIVEALDIVRQARSLMAPGDGVRRARLLANEGSLLFLTGRYEEAIGCYRKSAHLLDREGLPLDAAISRYNIGNTSLYRGRTTEARDAFDAALPVFHQANRPQQEAYVRFGFVLADIIDGRWEGTLQRLHELELEMEEVGDLRAMATMAKESSELLLRLGALGPAEAAARRALETYRRLGLQRNVAHLGFLHGRVLARQGRYQEAVPRFEESRDNFHEMQDPWASRRVELELAGIRILQGRTKEALEALRQFGKRGSGRSERLLSARTRQLMAEAHLAAGHAGRALQVARRAHRDARDPLLAPARPELALLCAEAAGSQGRQDLARTWIQRAISAQLEFTLRTRGEMAVKGETEGQRSFRERMIRIAVPAYGPRRAAKLLSLALDVLPSPDIRGRNKRSANALATKMTGLRDELLNVTDGRDRAVRYRELEARLEEAIRLRPEKEVAPIGPSQRVDWAQRLGGRSLVVFLTDDSSGAESHWHAYVVNPDGRVRLVPLPDAGQALQRDWIPLRLVLEQAAHLPSKVRPIFLDQTRQQACATMDSLRRAFWDPLELTAGRVVIVVDSPAQGIPFESLAASGPQSTKEPCVVSRLPHPDLLRPQRLRRAAPQGLALVLHDGNEGTKAEAAEVRRTLRKQGLPARLDSRRRALGELSERARVLHVAAHGVYHREQWLLNGIRLRDGWMGIESLTAAPLRNSLLFLSSCDSGLQHNAPGAQVGGWAEAGLSAGASEMILALWKIPDDFATLFARAFYAEWTRGISADYAAAKARVAVREHEQHPFAWAAYSSVVRD